ncbi:MAG: alpha/beta fold hydrolase [Rhodospirillaceae bacterium]|nr:alpha/beta fold hydrolase [Rhodospirillaceae bacterium]
MTSDHSILFEGKGPVGVLLIHGLGGTPIEMKSLGRALYDAGANVYCCQLAGHCGTEEDIKKTGWKDWYASAEAGIAVLERSSEHIVVGGLSMGGCVAAELAAHHPTRVDGLIMLAPTLKYDGWSMPRYSFLLKILINTPFGQRFRFIEQDPYGVKDERTRRLVVKAMHSADSSNAGLLATPSQALQQMWALNADLKKRLGSIRQPTLIIHSREDDVASLGNAVYLQKHLGGLVRTLVLDDSYHLVTLDRQRHIVAEEAAHFVSSFARKAEEKPQKGGALGQNRGAAHAR